MCAVSFVGTGFQEHFEQPKYYPNGNAFWDNLAGINRSQFDALKSEVELMKKLLIKAKIYDKETGQPDCEMESKVKFIKEIAEKMGVDLKGIFDEK